MNCAQEQEHLAQAYRHIADLRDHILRQRVMLKHALDTGQPSELAESMLHTLEGSLRAFEKHRQLTRTCAAIPTRRGHARSIGWFAIGFSRLAMASSVK